jgi:hypothetical protein
LKVAAMTSRKLLTLTLLAIVVIGAGLWLASRQSASGNGTADQALYPELKKQLDAVTAVQIFKPGDTRAVELARKDTAWVVSDRSGYPADEAKLRKLLRGITDAKLYEEKTSNPEQYKSLGVDDLSKAGASGVRIVLVGPSSPVNLIVGKPGSGSQSSYVRRAGEPKSWLVNASIDTTSSPDAWLRKEVIDVSADRIQSAAVSAGTKSYTAAKTSRADANFKVDGLPKSKELSSPSAANSFATALAGLTLSDVQPAAAFDATAPAARATLKTFDGLVADVSGWTKDGKHYVAIKTSFDPAQAERFNVATAPAVAKADAKAAAPADAKPAAPAKTANKAPATQGDTEGGNKPAAPPAAKVEDEVKAANGKLDGWVYEIPEYKYESIFKPLDGLLKK